jgi:hypothetical protein
MRISAMLVLGLLTAGSAVAEEPVVHQRRPETYQAPPPLPTPAIPQAPAAAAPKRSSDLMENENEEKRTGLRPLQQKPLDPKDKPEMVGGKVKLWSTRDDPKDRGVFAFLGNRIGDEINVNFPDPTEKDTFGMPLCRGTPGIPGFMDCADDSIRELINGTWVMLYRGVEVSYLNYRYLDNRLVGFQMGFPTTNFEKLSDAVEKQYGAPHDKEDTIWKIRPGFELKVKTWTWRTPHGDMTLKSRAEAYEAGMLALLEPKAQEKYDALRYKLMVSRGFNVPKPAQESKDDKDGEATADEQKKAAQKKAFDMDDPEKRRSPADAPVKSESKPAAVSPPTASTTKRLQAE